MSLIEQLRNRNKDISKKNGLKNGLSIQVIVNDKLVPEVSRTLSPYNVDVPGTKTLISVLETDGNAFGNLKSSIEFWKNLHVKIDENNEEYIPFTDLTIDKITSQSTNTLKLYDKNAKNLSA